MRSEVYCGDLSVVRHMKCKLLGRAQEERKGELWDVTKLAMEATTRYWRARGILLIICKMLISLKGEYSAYYFFSTLAVPFVFMQVVCVYFQCSYLPINV